MSDEKPSTAARAHEDAHDAVDAARAARERAEQIKLEMEMRRQPDLVEPVEVDPESEAVLRAYLDPPPGELCGSSRP